MPIRLNAKNIRKDEAYLLIRKKKVSKPNYYFLSQKGNLKEAAKNLYSTLRKIKKRNTARLQYVKFLIEDMVKQLMIGY